jgi:hypothetical protein
MDASEDFSAKFKQLLNEIPAESTLSQWQYLYRDVIFSMGMRILERFSKDVLAPDPFVTRSPPPPPPPPPPVLGSPPPPGHGGGIQPGPIFAGHGGGYQPGGHGGGYQPSIIIALTALELSPGPGKDPN